MGSTFLQEIDATLLLWDVKGFSSLATQLGPLELGTVLERFYEHCEDSVTKHGGRVVKFVGDAVLAVILGSGDVDHAGNALLAIADAFSNRTAWLASNQQKGLPVLDYKVVASSGPVLAGYLGTARLKFWDVLGEPVNTAFRLSGLAAAREVSHLVTAETVEAAKQRPSAIEVESIELGGKRIRLYKLEQV